MATCHGILKGTSIYKISKLLKTYAWKQYQEQALVFMPFRTTLFIYIKWLFSTKGKGQLCKCLWRNTSFEFRATAVSWLMDLAEYRIFLYLWRSSALQECLFNSSCIFIDKMNTIKKSISFFSPPKGTISSKHCLWRFILLYIFPTLLTLGVSDWPRTFVCKVYPLSLSYSSFCDVWWKHVVI